MTPINPTQAIWVHRQPDFRGGCIINLIRVEIIGATERSYRVKLLTTGEIKTVRKRNVRLMAPAEPRDMSRVRMPYKD